MKNKIKYYFYRILANFTFGKTKDKLILKKNKYKSLLDKKNNAISSLTNNTTINTLIESKLNNVDENILIDALKKYYFQGEWTITNGVYFLDTEDGKKDLYDHLYGRLNEFSKTILPWLNSIKQLDSTEILEIGCGTGSSTVGLAKMGAKVTAIDYAKNSIEVAKIRCNLYQVGNVDIKLLNALDAKSTFNKKFDFVIFFDSLEHMTYKERLQIIRDAYDLIKSDGVIVVTGCPNRLWYFDHHTSHSHFFNWLNDDLAIDYAKYTNRLFFNTNKNFIEHDEKAVEGLYRWGRGVSFHEFVVALDGIDKIKVISSMQNFLGYPDSEYKLLLKKLGPQGIHEAFYNDSLYIALKK